MSEFQLHVIANNTPDWGRMLSFTISKNIVEHAECVLKRSLKFNEYIVCNGLSLRLAMNDEKSASFFAKKQWNDVVSRASTCQGAQTVSNCTATAGQAKALAMQHSPLPPVTQCNDNTVCFPLPFEFQGESAWTLDLDVCNVIEIILEEWNKRDPSLVISNASIVATFSVRENPLKRIVQDHGPVSFYAHETKESLRTFKFPMYLLPDTENAAQLRFIYSTIVLDTQEPHEENYAQQNVRMSLEFKIRTSIGTPRINTFLMKSTAAEWQQALRPNHGEGKALAETAEKLASLPAYVWTNVFDLQLADIESASITVILGGTQKVAFRAEPICVYDTEVKQNNSSTAPVTTGGNGGTETEIDAILKSLQQRVKALEQRV